MNFLDSKNNFEGQFRSGAKEFEGSKKKGRDFGSKIFLDLDRRVMIRNTGWRIIRTFIMRNILRENVLRSKAKKITTISWESLMNSALFIRVHNFQERIVFLVRKHKSRRVRRRKGRNRSSVKKVLRSD